MSEETMDLDMSAIVGAALAGADADADEIDTSAEDTGSQTQDEDSGQDVAEEEVKTPFRELNDPEPDSGDGETDTDTDDDSEETVSDEEEADDEAEEESSTDSEPDLRAQFAQLKQDYASQQQQHQQLMAWAQHQANLQQQQQAASRGPDPTQAAALKLLLYQGEGWQEKFNTLPQASQDFARTRVQQHMQQSVEELIDPQAAFAKRYGQHVDQLVQQRVQSIVAPLQQRDLEGRIADLTRPHRDTLLSTKAAEKRLTELVFSDDMRVFQAPEEKVKWALKLLKLEQLESGKQTSEKVEKKQKERSRRQRDARRGTRARRGGRKVLTPEQELDAKHARQIEQGHFGTGDMIADIVSSALNEAQ